MQMGTRENPLRSWEVERELLDRFAPETRAMFEVMAKRDLFHLGIAFLVYGNGAHAWRAVCIVDALGLDRPRWLGTYLADAARRMVGGAAPLQALRLAPERGGAGFGWRDADEQLSNVQGLLSRLGQIEDDMQRSAPNAPRSMTAAYKLLASEGYGPTWGAVKKTLDRIKQRVREM